MAAELFVAVTTAIVSDRGTSANAFVPWTLGANEPIPAGLLSLHGTISQIFKATGFPDPKDLASAVTLALSKSNSLAKRGPASSGVYFFEACDGNVFKWNPHTAANKATAP